MNLAEMKNHHIKFCDWLESLLKIDNNTWNSPLEEGKWSIGAVIGHILLWDQQSVKDRFPNFKEGAKLPGYPDFQEVNDAAKEYVESGVTKEEVIKELLDVRREIIGILNKYTEETLLQSFSIGNHLTSIGENVQDFILHDLHHQKQIENALSREMV